MSRKRGKTFRPPWILWDGRARFDLERAIPILTANSPSEDDRLEYGDDTIWMDPDGNLRFDLSPIPGTEEPHP